MKKKILLIALISMIAFPTFMSAESRFGIKGGINITKLGNVNELGDALKNNTGFNVGAAWQLGLPLGFAIQPELIYSQRGATVNVAITDADLKISSLQLPINVQWGMEFGIFKPFVQVTPYFGYALGKDFKLGNIDLGSDEWKNINRFQYGLGLGAGIQVSALQLSLRYLWDLGPIADFKNISSSLSGINEANFKGLEISLALLF